MCIQSFRWQLCACMAALWYSIMYIVYRYIPDQLIVLVKIMYIFNTMATILYQQRPSTTDAWSLALHVHLRMTKPTLMSSLMILKSAPLLFSSWTNSSSSTCVLRASHATCNYASSVNFYKSTAFRFHSQPK